MSTVPTNNAKSLASKLLNTMKTASPNQGFGGLGAWPNEAAVVSEELTCELSAVTFKWDAKFRYGDGPNTKEIPALEVQAFYVWNEDPSGQPLSWKGAPVTIPFDQAGLPKNQQDRVRIAAERLAGNILGLLGVKYDDLELAQRLIAKMFEDNKAIGGTVYVKVYKKHTKREDKKTKQTRFDKEDFIREVLAGQTQTAETPSEPGTEETSEQPADASTGG